jgi:glutamate-1-semialdehyde 2,1-aminomutase
VSLSLIKENCKLWFCVARSAVVSGLQFHGVLPCFKHRSCVAADTVKFGKFHRGMLEHGVYLAPSQFEAGFTSLAHTEADIDATIEAARSVLKSL